MPESGSLSAARLGRIVEDAASEVYVFSADDFRFLLVNRGARENLCLTAEDMASLHPWDIKPDYTEAEFRAAVEPLREGRTDKLLFETRHRRSDGSCYNVDVSLQLIESGGEPLFYAAIRDVTEQKKIWRDLEAATARLDAILNNTTMAVFMTDESQQCSFMNRAAEEMTGFTLAETQGRRLHDLIHHRHPDGTPYPIEECPIDRALPEDYQVQGEEVFIHRDGHSYNVAFTASPMKDKAGATVGTVIEARNIDEELEARRALDSFNAELRRRIDDAMAEREALEAQLVQAQKMEAIGQLTGGIAHDFNNLLQVIGGNLELLNADPDISGRNAERVGHAISGVKRGANLATQLLAFGRQQPLKPEPIDAGRIIRGMHDMFRRTLGETIEVETVVAKGLWNCMVDPRQLENVLLNLVINARDAMEGEGKLTVEAGNASLDDGYVRSNPEVQEGEYVIVTVTDNGCGICKDDLERVFEPFFTTKETGRGTGLGLSMVFGFVKQSGGHVTIYSEPGEGTTVRIYLPRTKDHELAVRPRPDPVLVDGHNEVILVVEDDEEVRATVTETLSSLGYRVVEAENADAALAIVNCGISIDLLFTDVVMPGSLKSTELARLAQERLPELAVLFTSGYTRNAIVHSGKLETGVELISKPYTAERLSQKIRAVLARAKVTSDIPSTPECDEDESEPRNTGEPRTKRILVVEDEVFIRMALVEALEALGHEVSEAGSIEEARRLIADTEIDMVITDLSLPDGKADAFIAELLEEQGQLDIVIATGGAVPEKIAPFDLPVLQKPYSDRDVAEAVEGSD